MKKVALAVLVLDLVAASAGAADEEPVAQVSLVELIANPMPFHGKPVSVIGFVHFGFEANQICPHREDFEGRISKNCLWLSLSPATVAKRDAANDHYAIVEGRFDAKSHGHLGMFSGEIREASRLDVRDVR